MSLTPRVLQLAPPTLTLLLLQVLLHLLLSCTTATLIQRQLYDAVVGMICAEVAQEGLFVERLLIEELQLAAVVRVRQQPCHLVRLRRLLSGLAVDLGRLGPLAMGGRASSPHAAAAQPPRVLILQLPAAVFHDIVLLLLTGQHCHHILVG